jgi:asparagine synthase (glutamine-hydrolysing)
MNFFACLINYEGNHVPMDVRRKYEALPRARGMPFGWHIVGPVAVLIGGRIGEHEALVADHVTRVAVGTVRLDNRSDLHRWAECDNHDASDLELVSRVVGRYGATHVQHFLGDFAFLVWDATTRTVVGACDALSVRKLYWTQRCGLLAVASRAEALALESAYDVQYLAERVAWCSPSPGLTPYRGVNAVPAGAMMALNDGKVSIRQYWSAYDVTSAGAWPKSDGEAVEACRAMLCDSVRLRLTGRPDTWGQLSGGMDSSSVVCVAQWLAEQGTVDCGLAGTVTYVDPHGSGGDERRYAQGVVQRWAIDNEVIMTSPAWQGDQISAAITDEPTGSFETSVRDYRLCEVMRRAAATVLLTGAGGDVLFGGTMFFFADWVARGHIWAAVREMTRRAAIGRASFWEIAYRNALLPLLPRVLQCHLMQERGNVPSWVDRATARRLKLHERAVAPQLYGGRIGKKYRDAAAAIVSAVPAGLPVGIIEETVDVRHPFYYRPLVEFALQLPPELCVRPYARKWVLREAMTGILPELVRTRIGKGTYNGAVAWSLATQREVLEPLVRESVLADLGVIDPDKLRAALDMAQYEHDERLSISGAVSYTLSIEAWLQARSGRWPRARQAHRSIPTQYVSSL